MRTLIPVAALTLIVGCAPMSQHEAAIMQAQLSRPTFKVECPAGGCNFSNFEYYDPNQRVVMPTNGYDVANKALDTVGRVVSGAAPFWAISEGFKYMNSGDVTTTTTTMSSTDSSSVSEVSNSLSVSDSYNPITETVTTTTESPVVVPPMLPAAP